MLFRSQFFVLAALFSASAVTAHPTELAQHDIWDPKVLTPNMSAGWTINTKANVTWDTSDAPENISEATMVALVKSGSIILSGPGSTSEPLAQGFDLRAGFVEVTVPEVEPRIDYQVVLFGDSGNFGPLFTITEGSN